MSNISVYLDNCCYNRPYDDQSQLKVHLEAMAKMHVQKLITDKQISLVYSFISEFENNNNPHILRKISISNFFRNATVFVDSTHLDEVTAIAAEIAATGIKKMDSYQVACAIVGKADYFLTTDKRLLKYSTDKIKIINPIDFIDFVNNMEV